MATAAPESHLRENPFELARLQLHKVAEAFGIDDRLVNVLQECKKSVEVSIPTSLDDGSVRAFKGFRVQHNLGREEATARGALFCLLSALKAQGRSLERTTIAVQGFGNVGSHFAKFVAELGATVVAISDTSG